MIGSLFDIPRASPIPGAVEWMTGTLLGSVGLSLCVLAVALVGVMMLTGRLAIREGIRVVIGCFVLLGAPSIAQGLLGVGERAGRGDNEVTYLSQNPDPDRELTQSDYDPYAGAALRHDRDQD